jgi:subtilase family serine protease
MVNTAEPEIPAALAGDITGIVGLSGLSQEHSLLRRQARPALTIGPPVTTSPSTSGPSSGPQACSDAASAATDESGYTSTQLAGDYGLSQLFAQGRTGIGQTIGIVDGTPSGPVSGSGEAALDVEMAAANAPSSSIIVYEAPNETSDGTALDLYNRIATDDVATVVTTSWGQCEQENTPNTAAAAENTIFERMAAQGQTMVAASGDDGSEDCYRWVLVGLAQAVLAAHRGHRPRRPRHFAFGRSGPRRGVLLRPRRRLVLHRGDEYRLPGDRWVPGRCQSGL